MQNSFNKYGINNFKTEIVIECSEQELDEKEIYFIKYFDSFNNGFNQTLGGDGIRGYHHTEEALRKISERSRQMTLSEEHKQAISEHAKERWNNWSEEERKKINEKGWQTRREKQGEVHLSQEHKEVLRKGLENFVYSDELKEKISQSAKNRKYLNPIPPDVKFELILYIKENELTDEQISNELNIRPETVYTYRQWLKNFPDIKYPEELPRKLTDDEEYEIIQLLKQGTLQMDIVYKYGIPRTAIQKIKKKYKNEF